MSNYRIVKNTFRDLSVNYHIEKRALAHTEKWNSITVRQSIEEARKAVKFLECQEIISREVVE